MITVSDLYAAPLSGLNHIDALLNIGPYWNFQTAGGNTITYTFSTSSGLETFTNESPIQRGSLETMTAAQQANVRTAMAYLSSVTGIVFQETSDGNAASLHLANANLLEADTSGLFSWNDPYSYNTATNEVISYAVNAYIYLDNAEWASDTYKLDEGGPGYETLLHELGHVLGLKHPFSGDIQLPYNQDSTAFTLMSYDAVGGPYARFSPYDLAALNWLYGGDGLGGAIGIGSASGARYITGTARADQLIGTDANDILQGLDGDDKIVGGTGIDTAVFSFASNNYTVASTSSGALQVNGAEGSDLLYSVETLKFSNGSFSPAQLLSIAVPAIPKVNVTTNQFGYVESNYPKFFGTADANAVIKIYNGKELANVAFADAKGQWYVYLGDLADGKHVVTATATSLAGVVSPLSPATTILVDTVAPVKPTAFGLPKPGSNQPEFNGSGEAGTWLFLVNMAGDESMSLAGQTVVRADGSWSLSNPMLNGTYSLMAYSVDDAENVTASGQEANFTISSSLNHTLTGGKDVLANPAGNNAIDGGAGIDTVVFAGARANYLVTTAANSFTVSSAAGGVDAVFNVERLRFDNGAGVALDLEGAGGQAFRLYQAALNRTPDVKGVGFWINALDMGFSLDHVAGQFVASPEFVAKFGSQSDAKFVETLYDHVLHRLPDEAGSAYWLAALNKGYSRAHVLAKFSESPENQAQVIGQIVNGLEYQIWMG